jgi:hypothetical protein
MKSIVGAVFPVTVINASRIFDEGKTVFVKFTNMTKLKANSKIVFYISNDMKLIGEGTIKSIFKMSSQEAWSKYSQDLFLNQEEYEAYTSWSLIEKKRRKSTVVTVFVLENLRRYDKSHPVKGITASGRYIWEEEYTKINR